VLITPLIAVCTRTLAANGNTIPTNSTMCSLVNRYPTITLKSFSIAESLYVVRSGVESMPHLGRIR